MSSLGDPLLHSTEEDGDHDKEKTTIEFKPLSGDGFKVSKKRWFIILVFCVLNMSNSMMW